MADTSRLNTLTQVAQKAIWYSDEDESKYRKFLQYAIDGYRLLRRKVIREGLIVAKKTPNALNRISFPNDMEEFIALGVHMNGKVWLLTPSNDIIATYSEDDDGYTLDSTVGEGVDLVTAQFESFKATGGYNVHGYYKVDWENKVIIVNAVTRSEVLLFYTTSGTDITGAVQTYVPTRAVDALVQYILWCNVKNNINVPDVIVQRFERNWVEARTDLKKQELPSLSEFRDNWARSNNLLRR